MPNTHLQKLSNSIRSKKGGIKSGKARKAVFYYALMLFPLAQFLVFYVFVNMNSVFMAFQEYDYVSGSFRWSGLSAFVKIYQDYTQFSFLKSAVKNSLIAFFFHVSIGMSIPLVFSYYIFKKFKLSGIFKTALFLPSMISSVVLAIIFTFFLENAVPSMGKIVGLNISSSMLYNSKTAFSIVLFYSIWVGLGTQIILYSGAMSAISESVIESAQIDGASPFKEFIHIVFPMIWPTVVTFVVIKLSNIFIHQINLFDFFGGSASDGIITIGYYLYSKIQNVNTTFFDYPYLSALGLLFTVIALPFIFGIKTLMERLGPKED